MKADGGRGGREEEARGSLGYVESRIPVVLNVSSPRPVPRFWGLHGGRESVGRHVELDAIKAHYESNVKVKATMIVYYRLRLL